MNAFAALSSFICLFLDPRWACAAISSSTSSSSSSSHNGRRPKRGADTCTWGLGAITGTVVSGATVRLETIWMPIYLVSPLRLLHPLLPLYPSLRFATPRCTSGAVPCSSSTSSITGIKSSCSMVDISLAGIRDIRCAICPVLTSGALMSGILGGFTLSMLGCLADLLLLLCLLYITLPLVATPCPFVLCWFGYTVDGRQNMQPLYARDGGGEVRTIAGTGVIRRSVH